MNNRVDAAVLSQQGWHADTFIQAENSIAIVSDRSFDEVCERLETELLKAGLGVAHVHEFGPELGQRADEHGPTLSFRARVFDIDDPVFAMRLLSMDADLACLLPQRIAVHDRNGAITVVAPRPTSIVGDYSSSMRASRLAQSLETAIRQVMRNVQ